MAAALRLVQLLAVAVSLAGVLQPCRARPLDLREHRLQTLLQKGTRGGEDRSGIVCHICEAAVAVVREYLEEGSSVEDMFPVLEPLCVLLLNQSFGYYGPYMCPGVIHSYGPVLFYVLAERTLEPLELCQFVGLCSESSTQEPSPSLPLLLSPSLLQQSWDKHRVSTGSVQSLTNSEGDRVQSFSKEIRDRPNNRAGREGGGRVVEDGLDRRESTSTDNIKFVHLSDIHLDRQYAEGSPSLCNLYLCCRSWYNGTAPAGRYGNYECDLPLVTLDIVVEAIASLQPQPDFIIYTGDNSPHDLWNETWVSQFQATDYLVSYLSERLPHTLIYPALGNHESYPESEYIGTLPQYQELTKRMAEYWQRWVPLPQSALETVAEGGYFTVLISDGLRLISFNSDYGYSLNLYTLLNGQNSLVARQQSWIIHTLEVAKQVGEKVLMIAHIPPGDPGNTLAQYDEFYLNITKRFHGTIVGHLFGHTHHDEFKLIQDQDGVYGTVMVSPSVTPRGRSNPSFRLFTVDPSSFTLLDYQQFHLNLTLANEQAGRGLQPKMELAYTTSEAPYYLPDLSPSSWTSLVERFSLYPDLVSEYRYNKYGQSSSHDRSCDSQCLRETICTVSNVRNSERKKCING